MKTARRGCAISALLAVIVLLLTACAGGKENSPAFSGLARDDSSKGAAAAVNARKENLPDQAASGQRCLKEGEPCSTLNDECCPGYRCPIGLEPKCVRNP